MSSLEVVIWSDYLCPWCYLNQERARRLEVVHGIKVRWMPYELHPDVPVGGRSIVSVYGKGDAKRAQTSLQRFVEMAKNEGLPFRPPSRVLPTRMAHLLATHVAAVEPERFADLHHRLFDAVWVSDLDITDLEVMTGLAGAVGADPVAAAEAVVAETHADDLARSREEAMENGVVGVPATMFPSGFVLPGFQDCPTTDRIAERIIERSTS